MSVVVAICVTGCVLVQAMREALHPALHGQDKYLLGLGLHGWALIATNIALYGYLCWLAYVFLTGWPMNFLSARWAAAENWIVTFAMGVSLVMAIFMLFDSGKRTASPGGPTVS